MVRILLTGATGYLGGETLHQLAESKAKHAITCLVRSPKGVLVSKAYPEVKVVEGDLDDVDLIEKEANKADIVLHLASTKHEASSKAIAKGLSTRSSPGYWIQMSGASLFSGDEIKHYRYGEASSQVYDNVKDIEEIRSVIKNSPARVVDNLVLSQNTSSVKTALVAGPHIYGVGQGPGNTRTIQAPACAVYTLKHGKGFQLGAGQSAWSTIHVADVGKLICLLVDAASEKKDGLWNEDGIYLPESGHKSWGEVTALIAKEAHRQGFIESANIEVVVKPEDADSIMPHAAILLGTNAKLAESKARRDLKWQPSGISLEDEIAGLVTREAERLGFKPGS